MNTETFNKIRKGICSLPKKIGRKTLAVTGATALIGSAVLLNFALFRSDAENPDDSSDQKFAVDVSSIEADSTDSSGGTIDGDYFESVTLGRQKARDEAMEVLKEITENENSDTAAKESAAADINRIAGEIEKEANIETMISAKSSRKCIAVINGDSASVIIESDTLTPGEAAQISEIVYESAGILPENLKIIEKSADAE